MKIRSYLLISLFWGLLGVSCKDSQAYWNPEGEFPLLEASGELSKDPARSFSLAGVPAETETLIINFFAPDCKPCVQEVPDLKEIYNRIKDNPKIRFISIGSKITSLYEEDIVDIPTVVPDIRKFVQGFQLPYPSYIGVTKDLKNFGLTGFPETFILHREAGKKWVIKRRFVGSITLKDIDIFIKGK